MGVMEELEAIGEEQQEPVPEVRTTGRSIQRHDDTGLRRHERGEVDVGLGKVEVVGEEQ